MLILSEWQYQTWGGQSIRPRPYLRSRKNLAALVTPTTAWKLAPLIEGVAGTAVHTAGGPTDWAQFRADWDTFDAAYRATAGPLAPAEETTKKA
jgi:hypothetical protein